MGLFSFFNRKTPNKAIFCGLDSSGKSTLISFLEQGRFVEHTPTMGKNKQELEIKGQRLTLVDMGGQSAFRKMWLGELAKDTKVVVFVVDRANPARFDEAKEELLKIVPIVKQKGLKFLLFANKSDLENAVSLETIYEKFNLESLDHFEIVEVSAKTGAGMVDAFLKFYSNLTGKGLKKNILTHAISIYNSGGVPLVTKSDNKADINEEALQGGFLSAITMFANSKVGSSSIKFESDDGNVFIVRKSDNFIGALMWRESLKVPVTESEEALAELLNHLENSDNIDANKAMDLDHLQFQVNQYCTNLF